MVIGPVNYKNLLGMFKKGKNPKDNKQTRTYINEPEKQSSNNQSSHNLADKLKVNRPLWHVSTTCLLMVE